MKRIPKIKIPAGYFEGDGDVDALPKTEGVQVRRLDAKALIIDAQVQQNPMISFFLTAAFGSAAITFFVIQEALASGITDRLSGGMLFFWWVVVAIGISGVALICYLLYIAFLQRSPSPILFDRERRKVYGSHRGVAFDLDWARVGPAIVSAPMVMRGGGYMTLYNLNLVQYAEGKPRDAASIERGIQLSAGNAGTIGCMGLWQYLRSYMDEGPQKLPPTKVQPECRDWTYRWLERGIYGGFYAGHPMIAHLREHNGNPPLDFWVAGLMFVCAPGLLLSFYDAWLRPQTRLDPAWIPAQDDSPNPYRTTLPTPADRVLREKAARRVMLWTALLIGGGGAFWGWAGTVVAG